MKILVLIKEVPDMKKVSFDRERGVVNRSSAPAEINPFDENALQTAIELKKKIPGAAVTVMTMGPARAEGSLRIAYGRGADEGVLLTDVKFGGSDTCATSKTLAAAIRKLGGFDLIFAGEKSVDGDTAQVGPEVAENLGIPHACYVDGIRDITEDSITVSCEELWGEKQVRRMTLPALVSVTKNIMAPKLATVKRRLESREMEITRLTLQDLEGYLRAEETGSKGSPTKVSRIVIPSEVRRESVIYREDREKFFEEAVNILGA